MSEWRDIESAPKDGKHVLLHIRSEEGEYLCEGYYDKNTWETAERYLEEDQVLGWMPLPELPKKKHYCSDDPLRRENSIHCTDDQNEQGLIVSTQTGWFKVNFCPFCGAKADTNN